MTMSFVRPSLDQQDPKLPRAVSDALNASADNLRYDRVEDAPTFLDRVQVKVDAYKAGRAAGPGMAVKP